MLDLKKHFSLVDDSQMCLWATAVKVCVLLHVRAELLVFLILIHLWNFLLARLSVAK